MGNTYRVGVVGCGGMGRSHTKQWNSRSDTKVAAVTDLNQEVANQLAEENDVPAVYTDYQQMFEIEDLDILSIPTWQGVRAEVAVAAANAGIKAILGEKPMCASMGEANAMIESCEDNGVKLAIGHQGRFSPTSNEVRRLVADGAIGEPTMVYHSAKRGAGLLNTGTHAIDGWRYILSDPETLWVIGQTARTTDRWERRSACEDLCMGLVCFEGGTRGVYEGDLPEPKVSMPTVYGTKGQIRTDGTGVIAKGNIALQTINSNQWQEVEPSPVETNQYQEMIDWIEGRIETHRSSGYQARYTIEIMMAIYESLRTKNIVTMPLETADSPLEIMIADGTLPVLTEGRYDIRAPFPEENR